MSLSSIDSRTVQPVSSPPEPLPTALRRLSWFNLLTACMTLVPCCFGVYLPFVFHAVLDSHSDTPADDTVIDNIASSKSLAEVNLWGTNLSGAGLLTLSDRLPLCQIDAEIVELSTVRFDTGPQIAVLWPKLLERLTTLDGERRLKLLDLSGSQIVDRYLADLHELDNLEMIDLRGTNVTDAAVEALRESLPACQVMK